PHFADEVRAAVQRLALGERVKLVGAVSPGERWPMYDGADLFVLPSHSENFGIVVTEAMARGLPVIVSDQVQSCQHVTQAGAGRVVPLDVSALTEAMDALLADPQARAEQGRRGQRYVQ